MTLVRAEVVKNTKSVVEDSFPQYGLDKILKYFILKISLELRVSLASLGNLVEKVERLDELF